MEYDERNGTAMFIISQGEIGDFKLSIEFQGGTYKVVLLHKDYLKASSSEHTKKLYGKWDNSTKSGDGNVYKLFKNMERDGWKIAPSKNLKTDKAKPRIALDKNIGRELWGTERSV